MGTESEPILHHQALFQGPGLGQGFLIGKKLERHMKITDQLIPYAGLLGLMKPFKSYRACFNEMFFIYWPLGFLLGDSWALAMPPWVFQVPKLIHFCC